MPTLPGGEVGVRVPPEVRGRPGVNADLLPQVPRRHEAGEGRGAVPRPYSRAPVLSSSHAGNERRLNEILDIGQVSCFSGITQLSWLGPSIAVQAALLNGTLPTGRYSYSSMSRPLQRKTTLNTAIADMQVRAPTVDEKQCPHCGEVKRAALYYPNTIAPDGLSEKCRSCCKSQAAEIRRQSMAEDAAARGEVLPAGDGCGSELGAGPRHGFGSAGSAFAAAAEGAAPGGFMLAGPGAGGGGGGGACGGGLRQGHSSDNGVQYSSLVPPGGVGPALPTPGGLSRGAASEHLTPGSRAPRSTPRPRGGPGGLRGGAGGGRRGGRGSRLSAPASPLTDEEMDEQAAQHAAEDRKLSPFEYLRQHQQQKRAQAQQQAQLQYHQQQQQQQQQHQQLQLHHQQGSSTAAAVHFSQAFAALQHQQQQQLQLPGQHRGQQGQAFVEPATALRLAAAEAVRAQTAAVIHAATDLATQVTARPYG